MQWHSTGIKVADLNDSSLSPAQRRGVHKGSLGREVTLGGIELVLFRFGTDEVRAFDARCPHAGSRLSWADIEDCGGGVRCIVCPAHGYRFDSASGHGLGPPYRPCTVAAPHKHGDRLVVPKAPASADVAAASATAATADASDASVSCGGNGNALSRYDTRLAEDGTIEVAL
jgi:nitrite reductase/ring-hydroxylating ferredoxin subunit